MTCHLTRKRILYVTKIRKRKENSCHNFEMGTYDVIILWCMYHAVTALNAVQKNEPVQKTISNERLLGIEDRLQSLETENKLLKERFITMKTERKLLEEQFVTMKTENKLLQEQLITMKTENKLLKEQFVIMKTENKLLKEQFVTMKTGSKLLREQVLTLSQNYNRLKSYCHSVSQLSKNSSTPPVYFTAWMSHYWPPGVKPFRPGNVLFDKVLYNIGNFYSEKTGFFTCPVDGYYLFFTSIHPDPDDNGVSVQIVVGKSKLAGAHSYVQSNFSTMVVALCKKNETASVVYTCQEFNGWCHAYGTPTTPWSTFTGVLLNLA